MKRLLSLSLFLMTAMLSFAHDFESGGIYYDITSSSAPYTVAVTYQGIYYSEYKNEYTGSVTIPESVTNGGKTYSVTSIGYDAFEDCTGLTSVTIPNSVTTIRDGAFSGCSSLTSVTIGNSVTTIREGTFSGCSSLTSVTIGNSVTTIGDYAFSGCSGLTSVTIPNSVTSIGDEAFSYCTGLTSITIPNSVTSIGGEAFRYCTGLKSVTIGNGVTTIRDGAFNACTGLTSVTIGNGVTEIGWLAFYGCSSLTSVNIPNSVTAIGDNAFSNCTGLTSVTIGNSVTSIGGSAFAGCSSLTSITIPNSVTTIRYGAFNYCSGLKKVIVPDIAAWCNIDLGDNPLSYAKHIYSDENTEITDLVIPDGVTTICYGLFSHCIGLTSVAIPNSVTSIGKEAFFGCSGLKKITSFIQEPFNVNCWGYVNKDIPLYVPNETKEAYQSIGGWKDFTNIIEFGGERIEPLTEPQEVDVAVVPDQMDLNGMVVGDTYYVLDAENGDGADSENGCVVINTTTTDEAVDGIAGKDVSDTSVKAAFKGIIFMVPAGTGTVSINAETLGTSSLMVKIGSQPAQAFQLAERETVEIPYSVAEPTYVYIYAGTGTQAARSVGAARAAAAENSVKVYSYKWEPTDPTGINSVDNSQSATGNEAGAWYTIDGRKLSGKPVQKGIYIVNGKKVAVK